MFLRMFATVGTILSVPCGMSRVYSSLYLWQLHEVYHRILLNSHLDISQGTSSVRVG